jgi:hypothetical protein
LYSSQRDIHPKEKHTWRRGHKPLEKARCMKGDLEANSGDFFGWTGGKFSMQENDG